MCLGLRAVSGRPKSLASVGTWTFQALAWATWARLFWGKGRTPFWGSPPFWERFCDWRPFKPAQTKEVPSKDRPMFEFYPSLRGSLKCVWGPNLCTACQGLNIELVPGKGLGPWEKERNISLYTMPNNAQPQQTLKPDTKSSLIPSNRTTAWSQTTFAAECWQMHGIYTHVPQNQKPQRLTSFVRAAVSLACH